MKRSLPWVIVALALIALAAYVYTLKTSRDMAADVGRGAERAGQVVVDAAEKFRSVDITTSFLESLPSVEDSGFGALEVATLEANETFRRTEERRAFWDWVSLGEATTEIRVPVTFRYQLPLDGEWRVDVEDGVCVVRAPSLDPVVPVAIDTRGIERSTSTGWIPLDTTEQMTELEKSITPTLERYAGDERHLALVREPARKTVARFVRTWLLNENVWGEDQLKTIVVVFEDEDRDDILGGPSTLSWERRAGNEERPSPQR